MTTIEDRLHDLGQAVTPPPLPGATSVMRRGRQRRRARQGLGLAAVVAVGTGGTIAVRALAPDDDATLRTSAPPASSGLTDDGSGLPPASTMPPASTAPSTTAPAPASTLPGDIVLVPDVVGLDVLQAKSILEEIGFQALVLGPDTGAGAVVIAQQPAAGTEWPIGATIRIQPG
jgi:hypothetical protein